ncbi:MAG: hypothetical protein ISS66_09260 [Desulfobacteraceae bacterium]|nr:hypothetical protein [Desulfobacteraceae bacterium]
MPAYGGLVRGSPRSVSAVLGSKKFVPGIKEKFMKESGVTQASQRISVRLREDKHLRKAVSYRKKAFFVKGVGLTPMLYLSKNYY